jgi:HEAT repeat protein
MGLERFLGERCHAKLVRFLARAYRRSGKASLFLSRWGSFDPLREVSNRRNLRLDLYLELAKKPGRSLKEHLCFDLEQQCRESRSNFARVVPVFGQSLSDPDSEFRERVAITLGHMGAWTRLARAPLVRALNDSNPKVALWSAVALSKLRDPVVLPYVIENLAPEQHADLQEEPITATTSVTELFRIQQSAAKHLFNLRLLLEALRQFGADGREAVPQLRELLLTRRAHIQKEVCLALAVIGEPAGDTVPIVSRLLQNPETRDEAASALLRWGPAAAKAVPDLIEFLQGFPDANPWTRKSAMAALGKMGKAAEGALPVLSKQLNEPDGAIKCAAALAIWCIAPGTRGVIEALVRELRETTKPGWAIYGCGQVIAALEAIGPAAKPASPILEKLLNDPDGWARVYSARTLWKIGANLDLILPVLIDDLLCLPLGIAAGQLAAECLTEVGSPAAAAIPRLKEILAREDSLAHFGTGWVESDESYRRAVGRALSAIVGDASLAQAGPLGWQ